MRWTPAALRDYSRSRVDNAYLEVRRSGNAERVSLTDGAVTIGRSADNVLAFESDDLISRAHAVIERAGKGWRVREFSSASGTWVNGERVNGERVLEPGDELVLGSSSVVFRGGGATATTVHRTEGGTLPDDVSPRPPPAADTYLEINEEWGVRTPDPTPPLTSRPDRRPAAAPAKPSAAAAPATPSAAAAPAEAPLARNRGSGHVRGVARNVQVRRTGQESDVLAFRVDRYDQSGNRLAAVAVELLGYRGGHLGDGEEVEVTGRWSRGTLRAKKIINVSTNAELSGMGTGTLVANRVGLFFVVCFIILCFVIVVGSIVGSMVVGYLANPLL